MTVRAEDELHPRVLFIDDVEGVSRAGLDVSFKDAPIRTKLLHPETVELEDLAWADLVIVDYFLNDWKERDAVLSVARAPRDGLAIVASMRSSLLPMRDEMKTADPPSRPTAFAIWSANVDYASFGITEKVLPHVFARENTLEWVFKRNDLLTTRGVSQVVTLAEAIRAVARYSWESSQADASLTGFLDLAPSNWSDAALSEISDCRPPLHELARPTVGMSVVRWLLHRILPYPCFLLDDVDVRARLRVDDSPLSEGLADALQSYRYSGALAEFIGPRWWRAGVESWLWEATDGQPSDTRSLGALAAGLGATPMQTEAQVVRVVNSDLGRSEVLHDVASVVRIRPDDWPSYADDAYATVADLLGNTSLFRMIDPDDRYLLQSRR